MIWTNTFLKEQGQNWIENNCRRRVPWKMIVECHEGKVCTIEWCVDVKWMEKSTFSLKISQSGSFVIVKIIFFYYTI